MMASSDPKTRRRGKANRELCVVERFSDEYRDDAEFWDDHPAALNSLGRMLARYAIQRRRELAESNDATPDER